MKIETPVFVWCKHLSESLSEKEKNHANQLCSHFFGLALCFQTMEKSSCFDVDCYVGYD